MSTFIYTQTNTECT